ncbi:MAG: hypothetical protein P1Q69_10660 [Candidatus Thorarchaeota archaeon]|nr:hypothetical protein [Candidatus Thorarchaeota archaeon]
MPKSNKVFRGVIGHIALLILSFFVLVGIIESFQLFSFDLPFLNLLILGYMLVHTTLLLSSQLGVQILELIRVRMPTLLIAYYFQIEDCQTISIPLLDPTKSKFAVLIILLVITGGPVLFPIFAIYGFLLVYSFISVVPIEPSTILYYFGYFLNWMPPILAIIVGIIIISIVFVEFKHL